MDDAVIERPPEISLMGVNEDKLMRDEISRTLALGEYMQGMPQSTSEPLGKVAMLLGQSNLRLSMNAQTIAMALTTLANVLIQMNQEFIDKDKLYRIVGDQVDFKEFKEDDKKVQVDAIVEVEPVIPPDKQARISQILLLYDKLIAQDKPDPKDPADIQRWLKRKKELQKMMLEELDLDSYIEVLLGADEKEAETVETPENPQNGPVLPVEAPQPPGPGVVQPQGGIKELLSRIPMIGQMLGR